MNQSASDDRNTEQTPESPSLMKLALELGPLAIFFLANWKFGIFPATAAFMVAIALSLIVSRLHFRTWPVMAVVTAGFVLVFGALTLWLQDDTFIKMKPTISNLLFASILGGGLAVGRLFLKYAFGTAFHLTPQGWRLLTWRWIGFFLVLAILNEVVWRNFSTDAWVNFKVFGIMPLTLVFALVQMPLISKHTPGDSD